MLNSLYSPFELITKAKEEEEERLLKLEEKCKAKEDNEFEKEAKRLLEPALWWIARLLLTRKEVSKVGNSARIVVFCTARLIKMNFFITQKCVIMTIAVTFREMLLMFKTKKLVHKTLHI